IPIYLREQDLDVISKTNYYLVDQSQVSSGGTVAQLQFKAIDEKPFEVEGLTLTPLPVWHGRPFTCFGFRFGDVCYISDVSEIPGETARLVEGCGLLILDALRPESTHGSHFTIEQAIEHVRLLRPKRTLFTDMAHDIDHEPVDQWLHGLKKSDGLDIRLAYDGLRVPVDL
ncbi:MAG: MBL fold metallo-hydrolase, partial [Dehalococcoidia bacterium]